MLRKSQERLGEAASELNLGVIFLFNNDPAAGAWESTIELLLSLNERDGPESTHDCDGLLSNKPLVRERQGSSLSV